MTSLVEDLLLLARLDAGRPLERRARGPDPGSLLEAVSDARVVAPDHRWQLDLPDEAVEVVGDEQRLHQVVTNLLTNARKHTPPRHARRRRSRAATRPAPVTPAAPDSGSRWRRRSPSPTTAR
jgi:signal transduction histidine kinase